VYLNNLMFENYLKHHKHKIFLFYFKVFEYFQ